MPIFDTENWFENIKVNLQYLNKNIRTKVAVGLFVESNP